MSSEESKTRLKTFYFCDETSFTGEEYMAVAGLAINRERIPAVIKELDAINEQKRQRGEIKWNNTRKSGVDVRKAYIDFLLKLISDGRVHFHIRFSPMNEYDHAGERRRYDTVSKMFYQLLLHRPVRYYGKLAQLFIRPDNGECTRLLPNLKEALHIDGQLKYQSNSDCIDSIIPLNSRTEPMLQLLDVSIGALTAYRNDRHLLDSVGVPKRTLAKYAYDSFGIKNLAGNYDNGNKLSVWNVIPKKRSP